jgi:hypothetical protein
MDGSSFATMLAERDPDIGQAVGWIAASRASGRA